MLKKLSKDFLDGIACETYAVMLFFVISLYSMIHFFILYVCHDSRQTIDVWDKFKYAENCSW